MVAIVTGSSLGLSNSSRAVLGEQGSVGNATLGQGNESIYVNAATGNLVIQQTDEILASSGLDLNLVRTYNSQGLLDGDNNDNWRLSARTWLQSIPSFSTPANLPNTAGSYIIRVGADGAEIRYDFDVARNLYVSTDGDGAHDTLSINTSTAEWTYTDGSSRVSERYDINGRLLWTRDTDGNLTTYTYVGALLTQINTLRQDTAGNTTTQNQTTYIDYFIGTNNVSQIRTVIDGVTQIRTSYIYDASNRLSQVLVDLTPLDALQTTAANGLRVGINGQSYVTTYAYDGTSKRVVSISQSDGTSLSISYIEDPNAPGTWKVSSYTDGAGKITRLNYGAAPTATVAAIPSTLQNTKAVNPPVTYAEQGTLQTTKTVTTTVNYQLDGTKLQSGFWETTHSAASSQYTPQIATDSAGNAIAVWSQQVGTTYNIYATRYTAGTGWQSQPVLLGTGTGTTNDPQIAVDGGGNAIVVWQQYQTGVPVKVYANRYVAGATWQGSELLATSDIWAQVISSPTVTTDANGNFMIGWSDLNVKTYIVNNYAQIYLAAGGWQPAQLLMSINWDDSIGGDGLSVPALAFDAQRNAIAVWSDYQDGGTFSKRYVAGVGWQSVTESLGSFTGASLVVSFDSLGNAMVVWGQQNPGNNYNSDVYAKRYLVSGGWQPAELVMANSGVVYPYGNAYPDYLDCSFDANNNAMVVWQQNDGTGSRIYGRRYVAGQGWAPAPIQVVSGTGASSPKIAMDGAGNPDVVWLQVDGTTTNVYASHYKATSYLLYQVQAGDTWASLAQTLYHTANVADELQAVLGTITAGQVLTNLPATLIDTVTTVVTVAPYYTIQAGDTWTSIAQTLYGTPNVAEELSAALGGVALIPGQTLTNLPASLTDTVVTVAPYYTVQAGDTWASIATRVYGVAAAASALQSALGSPTLSLGAQLTVPANLTYTIPGTSSTILTDPLGLTTSYFYDSSKRLTEIRTPALAGGTYLATKYTYDNDGNVATVTDGRNTVTTYQYDANGNPVLSRDALGNTVTRTYNNNNQLITESRYTTPDNDGAGTNLPSNALTTRYVYDAENHLRFLVSPEGRVTEYQYNTVGQRISEIQYTAGTYNVSPLKSRDRSLDFDGVNDAVTFADPGLGTGPLTIQAWVNADQLASGNTWGGRGVLRSITDNNGVPGDYFLSVDANGAVHFAYWNAAGNISNGRVYTANNVITAGKWYHIVATWDGTTRKIYVNGVQQTTSATYTDTDWGVERSIGRSYSDSTSQFDGKIDDVRLYTGALSQADITSLYGNDNATLTTTGAVLKARWKFDETSGITAVNSVNTAFNGTLTNMSDKAWSTLAASALMESDLTNWLSTTTNKANCIRTDYAYDFRGLLSRATAFNSVDANGNGITTDTNNSVTQYVYDQRGHLLQRIDPRAVANAAGAKVYENSGNTANWSVYDADPVGATITSVLDATRNKQVIQLTGDGTNNGYVLRQNGTANWNNTTQSALEWSQNFAGNFTIYIDVQTNLGHRYLTYVNGTAAPIPSGNGEYLNYSLGNVADGVWHTFRRDLQADMALLDPNAKIQSVNGMLVRGTGRIDGVIMRDNASDYSTRYVYDGLGRLLSTTDALGNTTLNQYDAAQNRIVTTSANGTQTTTVYNARGLLISQTQASGGTTLGTTTYGYDALGRLRVVSDPTGVKTYALYDEASRKVADIDATGALTEYLYTADNQVYKTIRYATRLTSTQLTSLSAVDASGMVTHVALGAVRPATNSAADQATWQIYDNANRLLWSVVSSDADPTQGYATQYFYDGANRLTKSVRYTDPVVTSSISATTTNLTVPTGVQRITTYFYSNDGKLLGTLDPDNYLTEQKYNAAGRLVETIRYNNAQAGTTLSAARPAVHNDDQHTYNLYNAKGQLAGVLELGGALNAEYYLTEYQYDVAGNVIQQTRYYDKSPITSYTGQSLSALRPTTNSGKNLVTLTTYNGANQVVTVTKNPEGTITRYSYDNMGRLIRTDAAVFSTDLRTNQVKYDAYGRVIAELASEGNAAIAALVNPTQSQINTVWTQYGISHTYDVAGRRTVTTDQYGYKTFYYYDQANRLRFTIRQADNGANIFLAGEITEREYDALGQQTFTRRYANRINLTGLTGGLLNTTTQGQFTALRSALTDRVEETQYTLRGAVKAAIDALGKGTTYTYNSFGEMATQSSPVSAGVSLLQTYNYNGRGLLTTVLRQSVSETRTYDAFGRVINVRNTNNYYTNYTYDRLGRQVSVTDPLSNVRKATYDAIGRVLTQTDALNQVTSYSYDDANRSLSITTPEGIKTTTVRNRHGDAVSVTDGNGNTTNYTYDKDGHLKTEANALTQITTHNYDRAGREIETIDGNGHHTTFTYDAVSRLITRSVDPAGLNLTTSYQYDAEGNTIKVTDANGTVTKTEYDAKGQVKAVTVDPAAGGLNLRTEYSYDDAGHTLSVTEAALTTEARTTQYVYDVLGRRIKEIRDPNGLNLTTEYLYDNKDNVTLKIEAQGTVDERITNYLYDANDRLIMTVDPMGAVTENVYDKNGNIIRTIHYANAIPLRNVLAYSNNTSYSYNTATNQLTAVTGTGRSIKIDPAMLPAGAPTGVFVNGGGLSLLYTQLSNGTANNWQGEVNVSVSTTAVAGTYTGVAYIYNDTWAININLVYTLDSNRNLTRVLYRPDVVQLRQLLRADSANDSVTRYAYDKDNRLTYSVDAQGAVTERTYDAVGNVIQTQAYATALNSSQLTTLDAASNQLTTLRSTVVSGSNDIITRATYDVASRQIFSIDAQGNITENVYDAVGNVTETIRYANSVPLQNNVTFNNTTAYIYNATNNQFTATTGAGRSIILQPGAYVDLTPIYISVDTGAGSLTTMNFDNTGGGAYETPLNWHGEVNIPALAAGTYKTTVYVYDDTWTLRTNTFNITVAANGDITRVQYAPTTNDVRQLLSYTTSPTQDHHTKVVYDAAGRARYQIDALGNVQENIYDARGHIIQKVEYAQAVNLATLGNAPTEQSVQALLNYNDTKNHLTRYAYDAAGRQRYMLDAEGYVTETKYDRLGQVIETVRYANALPVDVATLINNTTRYSAVSQVYTSVASVGSSIKLALGSSVDASPMFVDTEVFDSTGKYVAGDSVITVQFVSSQTASNGTGFLGLFAPNGNWNGEINLSNVELAAGDYRAIISISDDMYASLTEANTAALNGQQYAYYGDNDGIWHRNVEVSFHVDAAGQITRVIRLPRVDEFAALVVANATQDQHTKYVYDKTGRRAYSVDAAGTVTKNIYDTAGNIIKTHAYVTTLNTSQLNALDNAVDRLASVNGAVIPNNLNDRVTRCAYDKDNRLVFSVDAMGAVTQQIFDVSGNVIQKREYPTALNATQLGALDVATDRIASIASSVVIDNSATTKDRVTHYAYDKNNRVAISIDPMLAVTEQSYDALGDVIQTRVYATAVALTQAQIASILAVAADRIAAMKSMVVANANDRVTQFSYNKDQQLIEEKTFAGTKRYQYNAVGKVTDIIDQRGVELAEQNTAWAQAERVRLGYAVLVSGLSVAQQNALRELYTTHQEFDRNNRQTASVSATDGRTETAYDAFDNIVKLTDANGGIGYFYYNKLNRVDIQVDTEGYATQMIYDAFGNAKETIKYADKVTGSYNENTRPVITASAPLATSKDQHTLANYDARNRTTQITDAESKIENFTYDAFGNVATHTDKNRYVTAYEYDANGHKVAEHSPIRQDIYLNNTSTFSSAGVLAVSPQVVFDSQGNALAVWQQVSGSVYNVWSNRYIAGLGWQTPQLIESSNAAAGNAQIAFDQQGNALAVWMQYDGVRYHIWSNRYIGGSGWQTAQQIETNIGNAGTPQIAIDSQGNALVVWQQSDGTVSNRINIWSNRYIANLGWQTAKLIENNDAGDATYPQLAIDSQGNALAVWYQSDGTLNNIWSNRYVAGSGWQTAELIEKNNAGNDFAPQVAFDSQGNALAVWWHADSSFSSADIWSSRYIAGAGWQTAELVETNTGYASYPQVAFDNQGNALAVWNQSDGTRMNIWSNQYIAGTGWQTAQLIETDNSGGAISPQIKFDKQGNAVAVWYQANGIPNHYDVWSNRYIAGAGWQIAQLIEANSGSASGAQIAFDNQGNALAVCAQTGGAYNARWLPSSTINAYQYNAFGELTKSTAVAGMSNQRVIESIYDNSGRVTETIEPQVLTTSGLQSPHTKKSYDASGNVITETDGKGFITYHYYDASNRRIGTIDAENYLHTFTYDAAGNRISERTYASKVTASNLATLPDINTLPGFVVTDYRETKYRYDAGNHIVEQSTREVWVYDHLNSSFRLQSLTTRYTYDHAGNVVMLTDARGAKTYRYYDRVGNKTLQVDALGYVTKWDYDASGNVLTETRYATPLAANILTSLTTTTKPAVPAGNAADRITTYTYDRMNRCLTETTFNVTTTTITTGTGAADTGAPTEQTGNVTTEYQYDAMGNRTVMIAAAGTAEASRTDYTYDALNRLTREQGAAFTDYQGASVRATTETIYDVVGNVVMVIRKGKTTDKDEITRYEYDAHGNRTKETDALGNPVLYFYDLNSNVKQKTSQHSLGVTTPHTSISTYSYNNLNQQTLTLDDYGIYHSATYNAYGEVTAKGDSVINLETFVYDNAGRLIKTNKDDGVWRAYLYDANGNATAAIQSAEKNLDGSNASPTGGVDLSAMTIEAIAATDVSYVQRTESEYDARNELINTYQVSTNDSITQSVGAVPTTKWVNAMNDPFLGGTIAAAPGGTVNYEFEGYAWNGYDSALKSYYVNFEQYVILNWSPITGYGDGVIRLEFVGTANGVQIASESLYYDSNYDPYGNPAGKRFLIATHFPQTITTLSIGYRLYKETPFGEILISEHSQFGSPAAYSFFGSGTVARSNTLQFTGQQVAAQSMDLTLTRISDGAVTTYSNIQRQIDSAGAPINGWFVFDWSSLGIPAGQNRDYRYEFVTKTNTAAPVDGINVLERVRGDLTLGANTTINSKEVYTLQSSHTDSATSVINTIARSQTWNAFGEIASEIDSRGNAVIAGSTQQQRDDLRNKYTTTFVYNTRGQLVDKLDPLTSATNDHGTVNLNIRPVTHYYYNRLGQAVGERALNSNYSATNLVYNYSTQSYDNAGHVMREYQGGFLNGAAGVVIADLGVKKYQYDALGNCVYVDNELDQRTIYGYDKKNQLVRVDRPTDTAFFNTDVNGNIAGASAARYDIYAYDEAGHRISHTNALNLTERTYYDELGRATSTVSFGGITTNYQYWFDPLTGNTRTVTTLPGTSNNRLEDNKNYFGRLLQHIDLSNHQFTYTYNLAGWLTQQAGDTNLAVAGNEQNITFSYYHNGLLKQTDDTGVHTKTHYEYDANGNRTLEAYYQEGGLYYQWSQVTYDELNRVTKISDSKYDVTYEYDAAGNRRHVFANYHDGVSSENAYQDYWYAYDAANRFTVTKGGRNGTTGLVEAGTAGYVIAYNADSSRKTSTYNGTIESYAYAKDGMLTSVSIGSAERAKREYDAVGNVLRYTEYDASHVVTRTQNTRYFNDNKANYFDGKTYWDQTVVTGTNASTNTSTYTYNADGSVQQIQNVQAVSGQAATTVYTKYTYEYWDSAKQKGITNHASNPDVKGTWKPGFSQFEYDVNGHLTKVSDEGSATKRYLRYKLDSDGRILQRNELVGAASSRTQNYYYLNGIGVGDAGSFGASAKDYASLLAGRDAKIQGTAKPVSSADFDYNFQPINDQYPATTPGSFTAPANMTLEEVARAVWGDSTLWYLLADANGLQTNSVSAGQVLVVPNVVSNIHNNSSTFKVYNPGELIGDTSPTLPEPPPPPRPECGLKQILVMVIAVVVSAWLGPIVGQALMDAGLGLVGYGVGMGVGSAVGNYAGQVAAKNLDLIDDIDYGSIRDSFKTNALTGILLGPAGDADNYLDSMSNAAGRAIVNEYVSSKVLEDYKFDWLNIAAAAIAAPVTQFFNANAPQQLDTVGRFAHDFTSGIMSNTAQSFASYRLHHSDKQYKPSEASIFGNALGGSLGKVLIPKTITPPKGLLDDFGETVNEYFNDAVDWVGTSLGGMLANERSGASFGLNSPALEPAANDVFSLGKLDITPRTFASESTDLFAPTKHTVQPGENISTILGTSDPGAIGAFIRANGLADSTIYPGQKLVIPTDAYNRGDAELGQMMLNADNARIAAQRASMAGRSGPANAGFGDLFAQDPLSLSSLVLNNNTISLSGSGQPQPVYAATMQERLAGVMWGYPTTDVKPENTIVVSDSGSSLTNLGMGLGAVVTLGAAPGIMATGEALVGRFAATTFGRATIASGSMLDLVTLANWDPADGPLLGFGGAGRVANTPSARMFSSSELMGVEPASNDLLAAVGRRRDVVIAQPGSQELRMLDYFGAEASVGTHVTPLGLEIDNGSILLRQNPSKAAVLEEFLHGTQARLGITERLGRSGMGSAETHVKDFMIRHQSMLGLSNEDVEILRILRDKGL